MLPSPTPEAVLILSAIAAHTTQMPVAECSAFRWKMRSGIRRDNPKVVFLREAVPEMAGAETGAAMLLLTACRICERRCEKPLV